MDQALPGRQVGQSAMMDGSLRTPELVGKGGLACPNDAAPMMDQAGFITAMPLNRRA